MIPTPRGVRDSLGLATDAPLVFHCSLPAVEYQREGSIDQSSPARCATPGAASVSVAGNGSGRICHLYTVHLTTLGHYAAFKFSASSNSATAASTSGV